MAAYLYLRTRHNERMMTPENRHRRFARGDVIDVFADGWQPTKTERTCNWHRIIYLPGVSMETALRVKRSHDRETQGLAERDRWSRLYRFNFNSPLIPSSMRDRLGEGDRSQEVETLDISPENFPHLFIDKRTI